MDRLWLYIFCVLVVFFLMVPTLLVIPMSFSDSRYLEFPPQGWSLRWYKSFFNSNEWLGSAKVSFLVAGLTMILATTTGTLASYGLYLARVRWANYVTVLLTMPMIIPVILIAVGLFISFAPVGLNNSILGLVLAHSILAIPLVLITVTAGMRSFDINQEMAARSMGASRTKAFFTVTLPQIRNSVLSGALLAFIISLDEVVIALLIAGGDKTTLPRRMFLALRDEIDPTIAAISTLLLTLSIVMLTLSQLLQSNRK